MQLNRLAELYRDLTPDNIDALVDLLRQLDDAMMVQNEERGQSLTITLSKGLFGPTRSTLRRIERVTKELSELRCFIASLTWDVRTLELSSLNLSSHASAQLKAIGIKSPLDLILLPQAEFEKLDDEVSETLGELGLNCLEKMDIADKWRFEKANELEDKGNGDKHAD